MSGFSAIIAVANLQVANEALELAGFGPNNFRVPGYSGKAATHAAFHSWDDPIFQAAVAAIVGVVIREDVTTDTPEGPVVSTDPVAITQAVMTDVGAKWGAQAPELPSTGTVAAGTLYKYLDTGLWSVVQAFNRTTFGQPPDVYPALIRRVRNPTAIEPWHQPIDQYDSYNLVNAFTGKPDACTYAGKTWLTSLNVNVFTPGTQNSGWYEAGTAPPIPDAWPLFVQPTGAHDAYAMGAKVTYKSKHYTSKIAANTYSPEAYPAGWQLEP